MAETNYDSIFGRVVIEQGLCTSEEVKHCVKQLKSRSATEPTTLRQILVEYGFVTETQAKRVLKNLKESKDAAGQIPGYKVMGKLGAGAMAVVYKAKQLSLDRTVAIKVLPKRFSEKPNYIQRFFKEGKLAAKLNHNNIVQAIDVNEINGLYYFVMEYVEGKTIYDDLSAGKIFSEAEAVDVVMQVARALKHAHSINLIHRDVKPKNVMINNEGVVKLADMGLARETSDIKAAKSEEGKAFGTPYYIAPEQIRGEVNIDGRADIYALGATLYHMVTGRVPFEAETPSEVMKKHLKENIVPPDHINTSLSAGLAEIIEVMMAKKVEDRYQTCDELLADLDAIKRGDAPIRARGKFDMGGLEQLEEGDAIELDEADGRLYSEQLVTKYKVGIVVLSALVLVLTIVLGFVAATK